MDEQQYEYRTGRTEPRPKHNGLIAVLLILVIFLAGLVSALGLLNIRLFRLLDAQKDDVPLSFAQADEQDQATSGAGELTMEGMTVAEIPDIYQQMCDLPHGLYISHVDPNSYAAKQGVAAGDVLTHFAGKPVSQLKDLEGTLEDRTVDTAELTICRGGTEQTVTITLTGE